MWEEHEEECIRAIESGLVDDGPPSRRQRRKVLAVDLDGDVAGVLVATRGKRVGSDLSVHQFRKEDGAWRTGSGGGGSCSDDPRLPDRSTVPLATIQVEGFGSTGRSARRAVHWATIRVGPDIETMRWRDRERTVSPTGYAVVVWRGRRMPVVTAHDAAAAVLAELEPVDTRPLFRRLPWHVRVRWMVARCRHQGDWFNYGPTR